MQALVVAPYLPWPADHGGRIRSGVLLAALEGHDVHLLAPLADGERAAADELAKARGITVHALPVGTRRSSPLQKLGHWALGRSDLLERPWSAASRAAVAELCARHAFAFVVADSTFVLPLLDRVGAPLVLHLHNVESALLRRPDRVGRGAVERLVRRIESARIAAAERRAAERALLTITVSETDREHVHALVPGANVHAVDNSIDLERIAALPPAEGPPRLLFVGSFSYPPNREAAVELVRDHVPALRAAFPELRVRIVGRDVLGVLRPHEGAEGVEFAGYAEDLAPHYRAATAVYLPIRSGGGTRIKVLEALAYGRPVLSTAVGVEGLGLEDGVHYRRVESPADGVAALREVLAGQGAALAAAGRALAEERFGHAAAIARMRGLLETAR